MALPRRPRTPIARAKVMMDMLVGETPNDKEQVLAAHHEPEPTGRAKGAKARSVNQTRRSGIARKAAAARWEA